MTWRDLSEGEFSHRLSDVESARFDRRISRLTAPLTTALDGERVAAMVADSGDDVVILRYPADRVDWFASLTATGWTVLLADGLAYWQMRVGDGQRRPKRLVSPAPGEHDYGAFVRRVFPGYPSHYLANPLFDPEDVLEGYVEFAEVSVRREGAITVGTPAGDLVAFGTTTAYEDVTEWTLGGVDPAFQGKGVFNEVMAAIEDQAIARGSTQFMTSTVIHNTATQRTFLRFGFEPVATFVTVHAVRPGLLPVSR